MAQLYWMWCSYDADPLGLRRPHHWIYDAATQASQWATSSCNLRALHTRDTNAGSLG